MSKKHSLREATLRHADGRYSYYVGPDSLRDAADLYAVLEEQHKTGSPNLENQQAREILGLLQGGQGLPEVYLHKFTQLLAKHVDAIEELRRTRDRDGQDLLDVSDGPDRFVDPAALPKAREAWARDGLPRYPKRKRKKREESMRDEGVSRLGPGRVRISEALDRLIDLREEAQRDSGGLLDVLGIDAAEYLSDTTAVRERMLEGEAANWLEEHPGEAKKIRRALKERAGQDPPHGVVNRGGVSLREAIATGELGLAEAAEAGLLSGDKDALNEWNQTLRPDGLLDALGIDEDDL